MIPWRHVSAGVQFAVTILVGVFVGQWADRHWNAEPWGTLVGLLLGLASGFYGLYREFKDDF